MFAISRRYLLIPASRKVDWNKVAGSDLEIPIDKIAADKLWPSLALPCRSGKTRQRPAGNAGLFDGALFIVRCGEAQGYSRAHHQIAG